MVKWSDFAPEHTALAPLGLGLGGAVVGGGLGWLYDKMRGGKEHTAKRVGIGALLGLLGGAGYGTHKLDDFLSGERNRVNEIENENGNLRTRNKLLDALPYDKQYDEWDKPDRASGGKVGTKFDYMLLGLDAKEREYMRSLRRIAKEVNRIREEHDRMSK